FDFSNATIAPAVIDQIKKVNTPLIKTVRVGSPTKGVTRVVMELNGSPRQSAFLLYNPFRLVIDVEATTAPARPTMPATPVPTTTPTPIPTSTPAPTSTPTPRPTPPAILKVAPPSSPLGPASSARLTLPPAPPPTTPKADPTPSPLA